MAAQEYGVVIHTGPVHGDYIDAVFQRTGFGLDIPYIVTGAAEGCRIDDHVGAFQNHQAGNVWETDFIADLHADMQVAVVDGGGNFAAVLETELFIVPEMYFVVGAHYAVFVNGEGGVGDDALVGGGCQNASGNQDLVLFGLFDHPLCCTAVRNVFRQFHVLFRYPVSRIKQLREDDPFRSFFHCFFQ